MLPYAVARTKYRVVRIISYLFSLFHEELTNKKIVFHCKNMSVVHIINKQFSKCPLIMKCPMVLLVLKNNISFCAVHIPEKFNRLCDVLSQSQVKRNASWPRNEHRTINDTSLTIITELGSDMLNLLDSALQVSTRLNYH